MHATAIEGRSRLVSLRGWVENAIRLQDFCREVYVAGTAETNASFTYSLPHPVPVKFLLTAVRFGSGGGEPCQLAIPCWAIAVS